jgi:hypothetical protein
MTMTTGTATELDGRCISTIRTLCIDAIQSANSGHPGTPIGIAPSHTLEKRIQAQQSPIVGSVASVFMSRWDVAVQDKVPEHLRDRLAIAVGLQVYRAYREVMDCERWQRLKNSGARIGPHR